MLSQTEVRLDWSWDGAAPSNFRVELRSGVLFVEVATVPGSTTHATLSGLRPKTGYSFRVRARTASGFGPYSEVVSARTDPEAAGDPGALSAAEVACDGTRLRGLLERLAVEAPNLQAGRGHRHQPVVHGDRGLRRHRLHRVIRVRAPEHELAFSTNPEETTLLRNPARPQLSSVSLTRNDLSSDLVDAGDSDRLRVTIDPTLTPGAARRAACSRSTTWRGAPTGLTSAKPGRGLAAAARHLPRRARRGRRPRLPGAVEDPAGPVERRDPLRGGDLPRRGLGHLPDRRLRRSTAAAARSAGCRRS